MIRKLLVVIEAMIVFAGALLINVHLLGKQDALPFGKPVAAPVVAHEEVDGEASEGDVPAQEVTGLVSLPSPFTADEMDRLARELFADRERLRAEADSLTRERRDLSRINRDLRSRRDSMRELLRTPAAQAAPKTARPAAPIADPRAMAAIFDKMRPEAAAARLSVMEPDLAAKVLGRMSSKQAAKALGAMDPTRAAALATRIPSKAKKPAKKGT